MPAPEVNSVLLSGATAQNTAGNINLAGIARRLKFFVSWPANATSGSVQIEEAYVTEGADHTVNTYAGTWSPIGSAFTAPSAQEQVTLTIVQQPFSAVQARVATTINGSGVTVRVIGN